MQPATLPGKNGEELVSCLFYLRETERHRFGAIEDALRAAFPRFERLDFPPVAAGTLALAWREKGFSRACTCTSFPKERSASDGLLLYCKALVLLRSPSWTNLR